MNIRWIILVVIALASLSGCSHTPDEQQVRGAIKAAAGAVESTDAGAFGDYLEKDFVGNDGDLDRRRLIGLLRLQHLRGEHVTVLLGPVSIERRGERLLANFTVTLGGGGLLPDRLGVYRVKSAWRQDSGDWLCYSASWKRVL